MSSRDFNPCASQGSSRSAQGGGVRHMRITSSSRTITTPMGEMITGGDPNGYNVTGGGNGNPNGYNVTGYTVSNATNNHTPALNRLTNSKTVLSLAGLVSHRNAPNGDSTGRDSITSASSNEEGMEHGGLQLGGPNDFDLASGDALAQEQRRHVGARPIMGVGTGVGAERSSQRQTTANRAMNGGNQTISGRSTESGNTVGTPTRALAIMDLDRNTIHMRGNSNSSAVQLNSDDTGDPGHVNPHDQNDDPSGTAHDNNTRTTDGPLVNRPVLRRTSSNNIDLALFARRKCARIKLSVYRVLAVLLVFSISLVWVPHRIHHLLKARFLVCFDFVLCILDVDGSMLRTVLDLAV